MLRFDRISFFENVRRCNRLAEFISQINIYIDHTEFGRHSDAPDEDDEALRARSQLNKMIPEIEQIVRASGQSAIITVSPPPAIGGLVRNINMIYEFFRLRTHWIEHSELFDVIERSLGTYEADRPKSLIRSLNPFFWLGRLVSWMASIPFAFLGSIGFNRDSIESSVIGRILKGCFELAAFAASILTILQITGTLDPVMKWLHIK